MTSAIESLTNQLAETKPREVRIPNRSRRGVCQTLLYPKSNNPGVD